MRLQPQRPEGLDDLAVPRAASPRTQESRELHRDRGCAGAHPPGAQVLPDRSAYSPHIDAVMVVEAVVLTDDKRFQQVRIDLAKREPALQRAVTRARAAQHQAVTVLERE